MCMNQLSVIVYSGITVRPVHMSVMGLPELPVECALVIMDQMAVADVLALGATCRGKGGGDSDNRLLAHGYEHTLP